MREQDKNNDFFKHMMPKSDTTTLLGKREKKIKQKKWNY